MKRIGSMVSAGAAGLLVLLTLFVCTQAADAAPAPLSRSPLHHLPVPRRVLGRVGTGLDAGRKAPRDGRRVTRPHRSPAGDHPPRRFPSEVRHLRPRHRRRSRCPGGCGLRQAGTVPRRQAADGPARFEAWRRGQPNPEFHLRVVECTTPTLVNCEERTLSPIIMPGGGIDQGTQNREGRLSPDGRWFGWTEFTMNGTAMSVGRLAKNGGQYDLENVRILNPSGPLGTDSAAWRASLPLRTQELHLGRQIGPLLHHL